MSQFDGPIIDSLVPQQPLMASANVPNSAIFLDGVDNATADYWLVTFMSLILDYSYVAGNASAEICVGTDSSTMWPVLAVAAHISGTIDPAYDNKYEIQAANPFYLTGGLGLWLRSESQFGGGASTCTAFVSYAAGFLANG